MWSYLRLLLEGSNLLSSSAEGMHFLVIMMGRRTMVAHAGCRDHLGESSFESAISRVEYVVLVGRRYADDDDDDRRTRYSPKAHVQKDRGRRRQRSCSLCTPLYLSSSTIPPYRTSVPVAPSHHLPSHPSSSHYHYQPPLAILTTHIPPKIQRAGRDCQNDKTTKRQPYCPNAKTPTPRRKKKPSIQAKPRSGRSPRPVSAHRIHRNHYAFTAF